MITTLLIMVLHANPHLTKAIEQVRALDEQAALVTLALAKNWPENTPGELAQVHLWYGLAYVGLAREADARDAFRAAILLNDALELPAGTSPVVHGWWKTLGGRQAKPALVPTKEVRSPALVTAPTIVEPAPVRIRPWIGVAISVAAATTLGVGVYFGVQARALRTTAENTPHATTAVALNQEAVATAQRSNWLFATGAAGALGGAALIAF
jgi:hypothetical protein